MKEDFLNFQLSKDKMNALKGGQKQACHCGGSSLIFHVEGTKYEELEATAGERCGSAGWACTPVKAN